MFSNRILQIKYYLFLEIVPICYLLLTKPTFSLKLVFNKCFGPMFFNCVPQIKFYFFLKTLPTYNLPLTRPTFFLQLILYWTWKILRTMHTFKKIIGIRIKSLKPLSNTCTIGLQVFYYLKNISECFLFNSFRRC